MGLGLVLLLWQWYYGRCYRLRVFDIVHYPEYRRLKMIPIIRSIDAVACVRKYFVDVSVAHGLYFSMRIGMRASMFISKPIQIISHPIASTIITTALAIKLVLTRI